MLKIYHSSPDGIMSKIDEFKKGCWVDLIAPTKDELQMVAEHLKIDLDFMNDPLDYEEKARIEVEEGQTLILIDIPIVKTVETSMIYETIPLGIVVTQDYVVTICLEKNSITRDFEKNRVKTFFTFKRTRFVFQLLYRIATYYLKYLKQINKQTENAESSLHVSMRNEELFTLLNLQKSLVYFTTSLRSNEVVLEKLLKGNSLRMYEEDEDFLEDVIIENKQAIEMANTYVSILTGMMDAFASVISNNQNVVMKSLTAITLVLSLPIMIASFYGMNVNLPMQNSPNAFAIIMTISVVFSSFIAYLFVKMRLF